MFIKRKSSNLFKKSATLSLNKIKKESEIKKTVKDEKPIVKKSGRKSISE